jgi:hypothetical protein
MTAPSCLSAPKEEASTVLVDPIIIMHHEDLGRWTRVTCQCNENRLCVRKRSSHANPKTSGLIDVISLFVKTDSFESKRSVSVDMLGRD